MKSVVLLLLPLLMSCSGCEKKEKEDTSAGNALKEGYVFTDGYFIIHWDKSCNKAPKKTMIIKPISFFEHRDSEYCSCVPIPKMKEIEIEIDKVKYPWKY